MYLYIYILCVCINISQTFSSKKWQLHLFSWVRTLIVLDNLLCSRNPDQLFIFTAFLIISTTRQECNYCHISKTLVAHKAYSLAQTGTVGG